MNRFWTRPFILAGLVVATLLIALLATTLRSLSRDRADLLARFSHERLSQLEDAAARVEEDLRDIADDLRFVGRLVLTSTDSANRIRVLEGLLGAVNMYHTAALYDESGRPLLVVTDPLRGNAVADDLLAALDATAREALVKRDALYTSSALPSKENGWLRIFAVALHHRDGGLAGAIALVFDTRPLLAPLKYAAADPGSALLVLGPHGLPTPASSSALVSAIASDVQGAPSPGLFDAVARMRAGERGVVRIPEREAAQLGFPGADLLVTYLPIRAPEAEHWAAASVTSMASLRAHEELLSWRFTSVVIALVALGGAFAALAVVSQRRTAFLQERLRHADEVAHLNEKLLNAEKLKTVGVLAAGIAHEIGTPLGVVRGRAEYLLEKLGTAHAGRRDVDVIIQEIDFVSRIICELLDFARPQPVEVTSVTLVGAVNRSVELLRYELERKHIKVSVGPLAALPPLAANADQLQQVLVNLVLNAMDACTDHGRIEIRASVVEDATSKAAGVRVEIEDNGCGIPAEDIHRVFDPFFSTKKRGQGTGLGLSVVMKLVRSHSAQIEIKSRAGHGTTMQLTWPIARSKLGVLRAS